MEAVGERHGSVWTGGKSKGLQRAGQRDSFGGGEGLCVFLWGGSVGEWGHTGGMN